MNLNNPLKQALADGKRQTGLWLTLGSVTATEMAARAGFDWLLVDMEHSSLDFGDLLQHLRAAAAGSAEPVVRVPWNDAVIIKRVMDMGARSLLIPYVQTVQEARQAVAATRYPPHGVRGYSGMTRANDYARITDYATRSSEATSLWLQVESPEAAAVCGEIAAVDGVDGVFVGPNDLAANMGFVGKAHLPEVQEAVRTALHAIRGAGKPAGLLDYRPDNAKAWYEEGFSFIGVGGDTSLLSKAYTALLANFK
ncbi:HpcH/HpaI aldolase/citrate lyase family protein [uncultured Devosia sp.]|uniref:HpcH/HpaI aldolase family protein n=1 Tax=uncultured Devosia sp. TaxID=211434 RepID=UPI0035C9D614